ncbi:MAG TPA: GNAT family N-acetyltransferase [Candidatus Acidoferrales bacterium]|nr:GNAT family N-acetyltransferase [Candidatus Acidoferrales bacterium]
MQEIERSGRSLSQGRVFAGPLHDLSTPRSRDLAQKVLRNLRDYGWRITLQKILAHLVRGIYFRQVYRIYRIRLDTTRAMDTVGGQGFTFQILTPQDTELIAQVEDIAEWLRGRIKQKLASGQLCLVALEGKKLAGFNLVNLKEASMQLVNLRVKLRSGAAWSEHIAVRKEFRRSGLGGQLRQRMFEILRSRGIRRFYGGTLPSNEAALRLTRSVGFQEIGDVQYEKLLSRENWHFKRIQR